MKTFSLLMLFAFLTLQASAQIDEDRWFQLSKIEKYRKMKSTGMTLTALGGIFFTVGVVTLSNVEYTTTGYGYGATTTATSGNPELGVITLLLGTGGIGAGVPLWIVGANSKRKWERKLNRGTVSLGLSGRGAGLTVHF